MIWYGLTGQDAQRLCREMGKQAHFDVTVSPRVASAGAGASDPAWRSSDGGLRDDAVLPGTLRVIRALEYDDDVYFTLGLFMDRLKGRR